MIVQEVSEEMHRDRGVRLGRKRRRRRVKFRRSCRPQEFGELICLRLLALLLPPPYTMQTQIRSPLPSAFRLVRQILQTQPRHFQDLLQQGINVHASEIETENGNGSSSSPSTPVRVTIPRTSKGRKMVDDNLPKVPEGHPFVSAK